MLVSIACRFVPYDQWLVTHVDDGSKVKQLKLWILSKCNLVQSHGTHPHRSVSPIVFASSSRPRSSVDSQDDGYNEDDEFSDQDLKHIIYPHRDPAPAPSSPPRPSPLVDQYTLLSFTTGSLLEDEFTLSWYNLRPYELLEMHPVGFVAPLQRDVLAEYIQPYFQAKVRVLRFMWNYKSGRFEAPGFDPRRDHAGHSTMDKLAHRLDTLSTKSSPLHPDKKRKTKADWKTRCLVINQGILYLCKEHVTSPPLQHFPLSTMTVLRGADALEHASPIVTQPRVVCIKFRPASVSLAGATSPPPSVPSSPISENSKFNVQELYLHPDPARQTTELENPGKDPRGSDDAIHGKGEWIVLDMLDDHAFSSILRILHRQARHPLSSSFVPSPSIITFSQNSVVSPVAPSFASYDTIPYPEWRINTVENARKAGMGDVGKAMAWVIWSEKSLGESVSGNIRHRRRAFSQEMQYKTIVPSDVYCGADDESDDDSEMEWEGWMRDLERQCRVKQRRTDGQGRSDASCVLASRSLPSPPLSEVSPSGSPRVGSPQVTGQGSFGSHAQYSNIGNVVRRSGVRGHRPPGQAALPEKTRSTTVTVSAVSASGTTSARRRSSTLLTDGPRRDTDKERWVPASPAVIGERAVSMTGRVRSGIVRHARSGSNLRVSSSPYGSDAAESAGHPGPSSPSKRQSAFMRGMTRKLVKGLESAIDFVDEKTV